MPQTRVRPQNIRDLLAVLDTSESDFGKGSRRLAQFFAANLAEAAMLSTVEVAARCEVNASSVVRLVQSLGYSGYREFRGVLQQHLSASIGTRHLGPALRGQSWGRDHHGPERVLHG